MRRLVLTLALAAALAPSDARAGLVLGARLGVAIPGGDVSKGDPLDGYVDWAVPIQLDLAYRLESRLQLGAYLRMAPGKLDSATADGCDAAGFGCSIFGLGAGVQVDYRFSAGNAGPWVGGYAGYEQERYEVATGADQLSVTAKGWELGAQGGIDFAWGALSLGPWAAIGVGQFNEATAEVNGVSSTQSIDETARHTWIQLGIRGGLAF